MSKDGKDAELMKLTEDDCTLIEKALRYTKQQFHRIRREMPYTTEASRAFLDEQELELETVIDKIMYIQSHLTD